MEVRIPENIEDITLEQYIKYIKLIEREDLEPFEFNNRLITIFCDIPYNKVKDVVLEDYDFVLQTIVKAVNTEVAFKNRFSLNGIEFGFIPNFDKITGGEWFDLMEYAPNEEDKKLDSLHKLMAILFRPITEKDQFGNYLIEKYNGTEEYAETIKQMPLSLVNGAMVFFSNLATELDNHIQKFIQVAQRKETKHLDIL